MFDETNIIFEDDYIIVVNKPAGLLTVSTYRQEKNTLTDKLTKIIQAKDKSKKAFPCHRLDRDTSGLIIYAKERYYQELVMQQFRYRQIRKKYIAFVRGSLRHNSGTINFPIENKNAITKFRLLQKRRGFSIIEVEPETGRTNQIRIHFAQINHPILGERRFAFGKSFNVKFKRLALHASEIKFIHPKTKKPMEFYCKLPDDMSKLIGGQVRKNQNFNLTGT